MVGEVIDFKAASKIKKATSWRVPLKMCCGKYNSTKWGDFWRRIHQRESDRTIHQGGIFQKCQIDFIFIKGHEVYEKEKNLYSSVLSQKFRETDLTLYHRWSS